MGSFHFPQWKIFFLIQWEILNIFGNGIPQHFMLSLKCDHPLLCEFPILFPTVKLKLGHRFSQLIHRFNIWILICWSGTVYVSKFFPIHKRDGKLGFLKILDYISKFFPNSLKSLKIEIFVPLPSYLAKWWGRSFSTMQGRREIGEQGQFFWSKTFFPHKIIKHKFLHVNNKWDFSLFIEKDIMDKK